jgi:predicted TIM-barrel fold metal-dependent hydrolase
MNRTLVTTDSHIVVPWSVADGLPAAMREQVPHLERRSDGIYFVSPAGDPMMAAMASGAMASGGMGGSASTAMGASIEGGIDADAMAPKHMEMKFPEAMLERAAFGGLVCDEADPRCTPEGRLAEMARDGISAEVLIGQVFGRNAGLGPAGEVAYAQVSNDWLAETYRDYYDRFAPSAVLPFSSVEAATAELVRAAGLGLRPAQVPDVLWEMPYSSDEWEPFWEAAEGLGVPICVHQASSRSMFAPWRPRGGPVTMPPEAMAIGWGVGNTGYVETMGWLLYAGVLERHPNLTFVMTETMAGWMAWAMSFFDHMARTGVGPMAEAGFSDLPSDYLRRQVKVTFMWDPVALELREYTGIDCLMWGNDYPHPEGAFPNSVDWVEQQFSGIPDDEAHRILAGNACDVYGLLGSGTGEAALGI